MSFFKNIMKKLTQGIFYVVDINTLNGYLNDELKFSLENQLEASANVNIYYKGEKHNITVWNYSASEFEDERAKGLIVYYDNIEYKSIEELMENAMISNVKLKEINEYFKIELVNLDNKFLMNYKNEHPELKVEDYD